MFPSPRDGQLLGLALLGFALLSAACNRQAPPPNPSAAPAMDVAPPRVALTTKGSQLAVAAFHLDVERVQSLLDEGVDPNSRVGPDFDGEFTDKWTGGWPLTCSRWTPLLAVTSSHREPQPEKKMIVNTSEGVDAARKERDAIDPKLIAERDERRLKITRALIDAKANLDLDDGYGSTSLAEAVYNHFDEVALLLIAAGAKLDTKTGVYIDGTGDITPLHRASDRPHLVKAMIERGVKVNVADDSGDTPLHWAVRDRSVESVKLLLAAGADPTAKDGDGHTPGYWCEVFGDGTSPEDVAKKEMGRLLEKATKK